MCSRRCGDGLTGDETMDLSKLSPAPWTCITLNETTDPYPDVVEGPPDDPSQQYSIIDRLERADFEFVALARNALDVMMRRKWHAEFFGGAWHVYDSRNYDSRNYRIPFYESDKCSPCDDPFTALVEADRWYKENIEIRPATGPGR